MFLVSDKRSAFCSAILLRVAGLKSPPIGQRRGASRGLGLAPARWLCWPCVSFRFWLEGPVGPQSDRVVSILPGPTQTVVPLGLVDLQRSGEWTRHELNHANGVIAPTVPVVSGLESFGYPTYDSLVCK